MSVVDSQFDVKKILGKGGEGTVLRIHDKTTNQQRVLKIFHKPIKGTAGDGLRIYSQKVSQNQLGLPPIEIIESFDDRDEIVGVKYEFTPLQELHWRILQAVEPVAQAMFGAYCRMQYYLMSQYAIGLIDTTAQHFLLDKSGQFHFIDFGFAIKSVDHPRYLDRGMFGYGFTMMLLSLYNLNLRQLMLPQTGYCYDEPCIYLKNSKLEKIAAQHRWVKAILIQVSDQNASIFLDASFYQQISACLPTQVPYSPAVVFFNNILSRIQQSRSILKNLLFI